jgi:hypothetical protein
VSRARSCKAGCRPGPRGVWAVAPAVSTPHCLRGTRHDLPCTSAGEPRTLVIVVQLAPVTSGLSRSLADTPTRRSGHVEGQSRSDSQADSAGSIPVTRSNREGSRSERVSRTLGFRRLMAVTGRRAISGPLACGNQNTSSASLAVPVPALLTLDVPRLPEPLTAADHHHRPVAAGDLHTARAPGGGAHGARASHRSTPIKSDGSRIPLR